MVIKSEKKWILVFGVIIMFITTIPYFVAYQSQGDHWQFTGFVFGVEDGNSYIGKMLRGAAGDWLFRTPYNVFPQKGAWFFLPYILLGKLTSMIGEHEQMVAIYQIFRWVSGLFLFFCVYYFIAIIIKEVNLRRLGLGLITIGGGLGWLAILGLSGLWNQRLPLEFYSPETFGFLALYGLPHLIAARAFALLCLRWYLIEPNSIHDNRNILLAGLSLVIVGIMQPLTIVIIWTVLWVHVLIMYGIFFYHKVGKQNIVFSPFQYLKRVVIICMISAPIVIYTIWVFANDPVLKLWGNQNLISSPPPIDYFLAYGIFIPFVLLGIYKNIKERNYQAYLFFGWIILLPILAYAPYNLQRRLTEGGWVAIVVLSILGLTLIPQRSRQWVVGFLFLSFLPAVLLVLGGITAVLNVGQPIYRPQEEVKAFEYFAENQITDKNIIAAYNTSNALPAWAPEKVFIGHGPESVRLKEIQPKIVEFFQNNTSERTRENLLKDFSVAYIFWGPQERLLGNWNPQTASYLRKVYDENGYEIYQVDQKLLASGE